MQPLGQKRPLLAYGVPAAAGLAVGGALAAQGEDPGSAILGGLAAGVGARGALGAARMAGKYARPMAEAAMNVAEPMARQVSRAAQAMESAGGIPAQLAGRLGEPVAQALSMPAELFSNPANLQRAAAVAGVPAAAGLAGLGGLAAGAIPGAMGVPGFTESYGVDPEAYGSSNSPGARYKAPTLQYV
jgi:hypothetical protein